MLWSLNEVDPPSPKVRRASAKAAAAKAFPFMAELSFALICQVRRSKRKRMTPLSSSITTIYNKMDVHILASDSHSLIR